MLLLDTNIVSFFFKGDTRTALYRERLRDESWAISFVTVAKLYKWPLERNWGRERREALERYLRALVVLPYDDAVSRVWAELTVAAKRRGRTLTFADSWIAATAIRHDLMLITHNPADFAGLEVLKIWSQA